MQRFLNLFILTDALHVSGGSSAHHQEHINVNTASGIVNIDNTWSCMYSYVLLMMSGETAWNM